MEKFKDYSPFRYEGNLLRWSDLNVPIFGSSWYVDGDNGADGNDGTTDETAKATIQAAVTAASAGDTIYIKAKKMAAGATDPGNYAETIIIPAGKSCLSLIGIATGRTQGGLPQIRKGSGTTALLTIRAPGCLIANLGFNGIWTADSTQSLVGILLDDDASTKTAFGTTILNCHFKNCAGSTGSTNAATGGAITWASAGSEGSAWQVLIKGCRFYKNVGDIVMATGSGRTPQDVIIEDNVFSGPAASVDCNIYVAAGTINGLVIRNNVFTCNPNIASGTNASFLVLTGCVGILADNTFAASTAEGGTQIMFGAAQENVVPTTMFMAHNYGEFSTGVGAGLISGEIFRT